MSYKITEDHKNMLVLFNNMKDSMNERINAENMQKIQELTMAFNELKENYNQLTYDYKELQHACNVIMKHISKV